MSMGAEKGIVLRKTRHRQILSIDIDQLNGYLSDLPRDGKGRILFEVTENPRSEQHDRISHFLTPLGDRYADRARKVDGPTEYKYLNNQEKS
jgi:hypothetical protein